MNASGKRGTHDYSEFFTLVSVLVQRRQTRDVVRSGLRSGRCGLALRAMSAMERLLVVLPKWEFCHDVDRNEMRIDEVGPREVVAT